MSQQSHLTELERKHKALENAIADAMAHPSASDAEVAELKRKKLVLKDEISTIRASLASARGTVH